MDGGLGNVIGILGGKTNRGFCIKWGTIGMPGEGFNIEFCNELCELFGEIGPTFWFNNAKLCWAIWFIKIISFWACAAWAWLCLARRFCCAIIWACCCANNGFSHEIADCACTKFWESCVTAEAVWGGGGGGILVGGRFASGGGNIPGLRRAGAAFAGDTEAGMPPVSTRFMSSPEHWNTSM